MKHLGTFAALASLFAPVFGSACSSQTEQEPIVAVSTSALTGPPTRWKPRTSGTSANLNAVAFGDGAFVAVGDGGIARTSPDGAIWNGTSTGTTQSLRGITYSSEYRVFVAVGDHGTIIASNNRGASWSTLPVNDPNAGNYDFKGVSAGYVSGVGVRFVAVGNGRRAIANYPFGTWNHQVSGNYNAVASTGVSPASPHLFVAVGADGRVDESPDAISWTTTPCGGSTGANRAIAHYDVSGNNFVGVGDDSRGSGSVQSMFTVSGSSCWMSEPAPTSLQLSAITYGEGYMVAVGNGAIVASPKYSLWNWTVVQTGLPALKGVSYGRATFVAVGAGGAIYQSADAKDPVPLGCYVDDANRAMFYRLITSNATVESCTAEAAARGFPYAGLQWYGQCLAGYAPGYGVSPDPSNCNTPCEANPGETCGGAWFTSMYDTKVDLPKPSLSPSCYADDSIHAMDALLIASGATPATCFAAAKAAGFAYAGLKGAGQCFAGNSTGSKEEPTDLQCRTPCTADQNQYCGGAAHKRIWKTGVTPPTVPSPSSLYKGCYGDDANRAFDARIIISGATVENCIAAARTMGYAYAGLQWYGSCWASNTLAYSNNGTCNTNCTANNAEVCGGAWANSVYATL